MRAHVRSTRWVAQAGVVSAASTLVQGSMGTMLRGRMSVAPWVTRKVFWGRRAAQSRAVWIVSRRRRPDGFGIGGSRFGPRSSWRMRVWRLRRRVRAVAREVMGGLLEGSRRCEKGSRV